MKYYLETVDFVLLIRAWYMHLRSVETKTLDGLTAHRNYFNRSMGFLLKLEVSTEKDLPTLSG